MSLNIAAAAARIRAAVDRGAVEGAMMLQTYAVERTPRLEGALQGSTEVKDTGVGEADVTYNIIYAARQHEETGWNHPRGGQAKFLESSAADYGTQIAQAVAKAVKGAL